MNATWGCSGAIPPPPLCPTGTPAFAFQDNFEAVTSNWTPSTTGAGVWNARDSGLAHGGMYMAFGNDAPTASDSKLAMSSSVTVPAGGRLYFDIAYEFESDGIGGYFDGGKLEVQHQWGGHVARRGRPDRRG